MAELHSAAQKAIALDPLSAEAYEALGAAYAREAQWEQAEKSFRRAIEIQPNRAESHANFAVFFLLPLGRIREAVEQLHIAEKSDPLSPFVLLWLRDALGDAGQDEEAAATCERLPSGREKQLCPLDARVRQGKVSEVIRIYEAGPPEGGETAFGCAYAHAGRREAAEKLASAVNGGEGGAEIFACLGDKDRVFEALDRAAGLGPIRIGWFLLRVDRENRGLLRGDPRLRALRKKVGLPE
jgi:tetratricopeptide (TPR) repeat protein